MRKQNYAYFLLKDEKVLHDFKLRSAIVTYFDTPQSHHNCNCGRINLIFPQCKSFFYSPQFKTICFMITPEVGCSEDETGKKERAESEIKMSVRARITILRERIWEWWKGKFMKDTLWSVDSSLKQFLLYSLVNCTSWF